MLLFITTALAGARLVTPAYDANCQAPTWSPDGSKLSYEVNYHDIKKLELFIYTPGGGAPVLVAPLSRGTSSHTAGFSTASSEQVTHELSWSPAAMGTFVYSASGTGQDYDLYLNLSGAIGSAPGADGGPAWSADGRWIVFTSARTGQGDLYLLDVHNLTAPATRLTTNATAAELFATWSSNGRSVAYVGHSDTGDQIYLIPDIASPAPQPITTLGQTQTRPAFSPDGQRIAFYSNHRDSDEFDLFITTPGEPKLIAEDVVLNHHGPAWTPDSTRLVYVSRDDESFNPVYVAPTAAPTKARRLETGTVGNQDLSIVEGQDGQTWIALTAQGLASDATRDFKRIYVMVIPE
ncbi:MAG: Tol biopolymer transport system component [Myxococcota bacterium]|jgi:Tol biopolymer transport system component